MADNEAGWRNDPYGRFQQRYFNGKAWTEHVATGGTQQVDPLGASSVIPIATPATAFATGGKAAGVIKFLDAAGPDSRERPTPSLRAAVAGLGGAVMAAGVLAAALSDDPNRGKVIAVSAVIIAVAWALRMFVKLDEVRAAGVGMAVVAIPAFAVAVTVSDGSSGKLTGFVLAALFIAAWALPGFKARNLLLALGALALVGAFGSLIGNNSDDLERCNQYIDDGDFESFNSECEDLYNDSAESFVPAGISDNVGNEGTVYLVGGALYLGLTWWLDRRGHRGTGTAFAAAGVVSTLVGVGMLADNFGETWAPLFVLAVGLVVALVGAHGARRATTWWGALLTTVATVWFVAVQWEPGSTAANGAVLIVSGLVLIAIPLIDNPIRAAMKARGTSGDSSDVPSPPTPAK